MTARPCARCGRRPRVVSPGGRRESYCAVCRYRMHHAVKACREARTDNATARCECGGDKRVGDRACARCMEIDGRSVYEEILIQEIRADGGESILVTIWDENRITQNDARERGIYRAIRSLEVRGTIRVVRADDRRTSRGQIPIDRLILVGGRR